MGSTVGAAPMVSSAGAAKTTPAARTMPRTSSERNMTPLLPVAIVPRDISAAGYNVSEEISAASCNVFKVDMPIAQEDVERKNCANDPWAVTIFYCPLCNVYVVQPYASALFVTRDSFM